MKNLGHIAVILLLLAAARPAEGQQPAAAGTPDADFAVVFEAGAGYALYLPPNETPVRIDRSGYAFSGRLMWHPDHRLRVGLESGWTTFYAYDLTDVETSFGVTDAELSLTAVPLLVVFSMPVWEGLELHAGTGGYLVHSHAVSFGHAVDVTAFSQGWMAAASYAMGNWLGVSWGTELKWYGATQFGDAVGMLQLRAGVPLLRW